MHPLDHAYLQKFLQHKAARQAAAGGGEATDGETGGAADRPPPPPPAAASSSNRSGPAEDQGALNVSAGDDATQQVTTRRV